MMAGVMVLGLSGCGGSKKEDKKNVNAEIMKTISEFYDKFYEEHAGDVEYPVDIKVGDEENTVVSVDTAPFLDCSANLEYCDGQWIMTIADFKGYAKNDYGYNLPNYDLYFYKCGKTVEELAVKNDVKCNSLMEVYLGNKLYVMDDLTATITHTSGNGEEECVSKPEQFYVSLEDGTCEDFDGEPKYSEEKENIFTPDYMINGISTSDYSLKPKDNLCGEKFTGWLKDVASLEKVDTQVDVAISKAYYMANRHLISSFADMVYETAEKKTGEELPQKYIGYNYFVQQEVYIYVNDAVYAYVDEAMALYPKDIWKYYDKEYVYGDDSVRENRKIDTDSAYDMTLSHLYDEFGEYAKNIRPYDKKIVLISRPDDGREIKSEISGISVAGFSVDNKIKYLEMSNIARIFEGTYEYKQKWIDPYIDKIVTGEELEKDHPGINEMLGPYIGIMLGFSDYVDANGAYLEYLGYDTEDLRELKAEIEGVSDEFIEEWDKNPELDIDEIKEAVKGLNEFIGTDIDLDKYTGYSLLGTAYYNYGIEISSDGKATIYIISPSTGDKVEICPTDPGNGACLSLDPSAVDVTVRNDSKKTTTEDVTEDWNIAISEPAETEDTTEVTTEATTGELMDNNIGSGGSASATEYVTTNGNKFTVPDGFMVTYGVQGGSWFQLKNESLDMSIEVREYTQDVADYMQHRPGGVNSTDNVESVYTDSGDEYSVDSGYHGDNHERVYYDKVVLQSRDKTSRLGIFIDYSTKDKSKCDEIVTSFLDDFQYIDSDRDANDISTDVSSVKEAWKKAYINEMYSVGKSKDDPTMGTTGYLYDIDGDGIPELMTGYSTTASTGPMEVHTYTYKNGKLIKMDSIIGAFERVYTYNGYVVQQTTNGSVGMGCGLRIYSFTGESLDKLLDVKLDYKLDSDGNPNVISYMGDVSYADVEALLDKCSTSLTKENFGTSDSDQAYSYYLDTEHGLKRMTDNSLDGREAIIRAIEEY